MVSTVTRRRSARLLRRRLTFVVVACGMLLAWPTVTAAHPLHTTFTDVAIDSARGGLRLTLRVFADDFGTAAMRHARLPAPAEGPLFERAAARYITSRVQLLDAGGRVTSLEWGGARREGETILLTLFAPGVRSLSGLRIANSLMFELFDDQINIVRTVSGERRTLLFTKRDAGRVKALVT